RARTEGAGALFAELAQRDPEAAARMDPHNPRRTVRALEVIELTGRPYSASLPRYRYVIPSVQIGLDLPREDLDARIDERTRRMFDDGFIDEVERLRPHLGMTAARALGYQQVIDYLDGLRDLDETMADVAQKTRRLARKQMGWFGRDPRIHWLQALNPRLVDNAMAIIDVADQGGYDHIDMHADEYVQHHLGALH
ncbi:tRNA dimethylallyltransferase, partial [Bifidobacterium sp.]